jgi:hypothetical protein
MKSMENASVAAGRRPQGSASSWSARARSPAPTLAAMLATEPVKSHLEPNKVKYTSHTPHTHRISNVDTIVTVFTTFIITNLL